MTADPIARLNAALAGRYRVEREIGIGGMATVYLTQDLKHERRVALKVLKPELAAVVGADRFLAEIKTTANLQHPHILPLHDSGEVDGFLFFVMPYMAGDTLRDKIDREKQLSLAEAVKIAEKVAAALDYAHKHGVVHRDIKPGNILLSAEGEPTIADFGIALAVAQAGRGRVTETGLSLGTPSYMSPEQATGDRDVDPRTDVYALGCVFYEMLIGEPPYTGSTAQAILGKIIQGTPVSATAARGAVPPNVDAAIRKALEKLPADRFASTLDFAKALGDPGFRHGELGAETAGASASRWKTLFGAAAALAVILGGVATWALLRQEPEPPAPVARFVDPFNPDQIPVGEMAFTPSGDSLVYVGPGPDGVGTQLWVRDWSQVEATPIRGTENVDNFGLSPDGREAVVHTPAQDLRIVPLAGGPARTLVTGSAGVNLWDPDGYVHFTPSFGLVLARVPAAGSEADVELLTEIQAGETVHVLSHPIPGGSMEVFQVLRQLSGADSEIWWRNSVTGERGFLVAGSSPRVTPDGHLLFGTPDGLLMAASIDPLTAELTGPAVPVLDGLQLGPFGLVNYDVSSHGALIYHGGSGTLLGAFQPVWVARDGTRTVIDPSWQLNPPATIGMGIRLSPDGTRVAVSNADSGAGDIWVKRLPDGPFDRLTFDAVPESYPAWTPDGRSVSYAAFAEIPVSAPLWRRSADGAGAPELLLDDGTVHFQPRWSPDGTWVVFRAGAITGPPGDMGIMGFRPGVDEAVTPLVQTAEFTELDPALSPDGRWLAYTSNESGRPEVYVRPFPDVGSGRERISAEGGSSPVWARSGREIFYLDGAGMSVVRVETGPNLLVVERRSLFPIGGLFTSAGADFYDVSLDDERLLMIQVTASPVGTATAPDASRSVLVLNWLEELRERMGER